MKRTIYMMLALGVGVLTTNLAFASPVPLPPGSTGVPVSQNDSFATDVGTGYMVLAAVSKSFSGGGFSYTLYADAIRTSGGNIDLLYQVQNTGDSDTVDSMALGNFTNIPGVAVAGLKDTSISGTNFITPTSPANPPNFAGRSTTPGAIITFTFGTSAAGDILPGQTSGIVLVETTARAYDLDGSGIVTSLSSTGASGSVNGLPEASTIPEPSSLILGSLASIWIAGVFGFRRYLKK